MKLFRVALEVYHFLVLTTLLLLRTRIELDVLHSDFRRQDLKNKTRYPKQVEKEEVKKYLLKIFTLFLSNESVSQFIEIIEVSVSSGVLCVYITLHLLFLCAEKPPRPSPSPAHQTLNREQRYWAWYV